MTTVEPDAPSSKPPAERVPWALDDLPPFPLVATRLLEVLSHDNAHITGVGRIIAAEPVFASRVLQMANSPLFALSDPGEDHLTCHRPAGIGPGEGDYGDAGLRRFCRPVSAYNLVRAVMCLAAQRNRIDPRQLSFTHVLNVVDAAWAKLIAAPSKQHHDQEFFRVLDLAAQCTLPKRTKRRSYPRRLWRRPSGFGFRTEKTK